MNPYDRLKLLANKQGLSINDVEEKIGLGKNTLYSWKRKVPSGTNLTKVADFFDVSTDYLLGRTEKEQYYDLTDKEKKDIGVQAEKLMQGIESGHDLNFYGEPATKEQKSRLLIAVQTAMEMNKKEAKKKFTPKKYRE